MIMVWELLYKSDKSWFQWVVFHVQMNACGGTFNVQKHQLMNMGVGSQLKGSK